MASTAGASSNDWKIIKTLSGKLQEKKCKSMSSQCSGSFVYEMGARGSWNCSGKVRGPLKAKNLRDAAAPCSDVLSEDKSNNYLLFNFLMFYLDTFFLRICFKHAHSVILSQPCSLLHRGRMGGCWGFGVSVTLPVWTSKTLNILPKVTNNSLSFPDGFQYSRFSRTSPLWRVYIAVLLLVYDDFLLFSPYNCQCTWKPGLKESFGISFPGINLSASLKMVEYLSLSVFTVLSPNLCWKNLEGMFLFLWKVLPSVIPVAVNSAGNTLTPLEEQLELHGTAPWASNRDRNRTAKQ